MPAEPPEAAVPAGASPPYRAEYYAPEVDRRGHSAANPHLSPDSRVRRRCAHVFLVEALRDRGVEAWGLDISQFAISQVRADIRPYCKVGA